MNIEDVKGTVRSGIRAAEEVLSTMAAIRADTAEVASLAQATLHDSRHAEVLKGLSGLESAAGEIELVVRRLTGSVDSAGDFISAI